MTYYMDYHITIGAYRVHTLKSCSVRKSVEQLSDTATIVLPGTLINRALDIEDKIHVGDKVVIGLGYRQTGIKTEFEGYVKKINTDNTDIEIECEDELYMFDAALQDEQLHSKSAREIIEHVARQVGMAHGTTYDVQCDYDYAYKTFTISHATGLDVLKKIQDETKANIYFDGRTLHVHPQYGEGSWSGRLVKYDMAVNVNASDLKYVRASDQKVRVELEFIDKDGETINGKAGMEGGRLIKRTVSSSDAASLQKAAESEYNLWCYDGYEGNLTGWLVPYCQPTDYVEIKDKSRLFKTGKYYVVAIDVSFSSSGGRRKVTIGRKMD